MSIHCQAMSDWFELSIRHSVIYDEIIMTYHIHGWSPLCSTDIPPPKLTIKTLVVVFSFVLQLGRMMFLCVEKCA